MADISDQELANSKTADLDNAELLGFEHIEARQDPWTSAEEAIALAFNRRGATGEGPIIISDRRLKTHIKRVGETAEGLSLYSFRYMGENREFPWRDGAGTAYR